MINWLPITCSGGCGATIGAAPPDKMPTIALCPRCAPGLAKTVIESALLFNDEPRRKRANGSRR